MRKINEVELQRMLAAGELKVPRLSLRMISGRAVGGEDAVLEICWRDRSCRYVVELKRDAKPQTLWLARQEARRWAQRYPEAEPMVVAPYLSTEKLEELLDDGVSALDFCGNAAIQAPGRFLFLRTGNPNLYRDSAPIASAYRGDGSLVPRVLLLARDPQTVGGIWQQIRTRGGSLSMGTVSKVLQRLETDLVIERPGRGSIRVIQTERILGGLLDAYRAPTTEATWVGRVNIAVHDLLRRLEGLPCSEDLVRTGESSAAEYAAWAGEPLIACYCRISPQTVLDQLGAEPKEVRAFANLRLVQTADQRVWFDRRPRLAASPIQSWLEMASGDKRQKETAAQIRDYILNTTGERP